MKIKCIGEKCKYFKDDSRDGPGYCGLIDVINNIFKLINLPKMNYVFWFSNEFSQCPFDDLDIAKDNNLDFVALYDLNKCINEDWLLNPKTYLESIDLLKKGGSKE